MQGRPKKATSFQEKREAYRAERSAWLGLTVDASLPNSHVPSDGIILGYDAESGEALGLRDTERFQGLYILGLQGIGKSSLLEDLIVQDIQRGHGVCVLDPHRDLVEHVLRRMPQERAGDVILLDVEDTAYPFGINLFACKNPQDLDEVADTTERVMHVFKRLWGPGSEMDSWGPQLEEVLYSSTQTFIEHPGAWIDGERRRYAMTELPFLLVDSGFREGLVHQLPRQSRARFFWERQYKESFANSVLNKVSFFLDQPIVMRIVGQSSSTIDMRWAMDNHKVVLVQLSPDRDELTSLVGSLIVGLIFQAAMSRADISEHKRQPFMLYADEFQQFATPDFAKLISRVRKFKIGTTMAHQGRWQFAGRSDDNKGATAGVGSLVAFCVNDQDAGELAGKFDNRPQEVERQYVRVFDPYHYLERFASQTSSDVQAAFARLKSATIAQESVFERVAKAEDSNARRMARELGSAKVPVSGRARIAELREMVRAYLAAMNQGEDGDDVLAKIAAKASSALRPAVEELGECLRETPVEEPLRAEESGRRDRRGLRRSELTQLDQYEALCTVLTPTGREEHRLRTPRFRPMEQSAAGEERVRRIRDSSRQSYARPRGQVEAEIHARQQGGNRGTASEAATNTAAARAAGLSLEPSPSPAVTERQPREPALGNAVTFLPVEELFEPLEDD